MKQGTQEWREARRGKLTATRIGKVIKGGAARASVMREMVREELGLPDEFTGNAATEWGNAHELQARFEYETKTGRTAHQTGLLVHPEIPWLAASPDGVDADGRPVVEIKCPYRLRYEKPPQDEALVARNHLYWHQMQAQAHVGGSDAIDHFVWTPYGTAMETYPRDDEWLEKAIEAGEAFMAELHAILEDDERARAVADGEPERTDPEWSQAAAEYRELCDRIQQIEAEAEPYRERLKAVKAELADLAGEQKAVGAGVQVIPQTRRGGLDEKRLSEVVPDLDEYRKPSTNTMTVREHKGGK